MVVLRKIKASTLMETMVGTVLIVVIFMLSSLVMNSLFSSQVKGNLQPIHTYLDQLEYQLINGKVTLPFFEEWETWNIAIGEVQEDGTISIEVTEKEAIGSRTIKRKIHYVENL
ncbi:hypothetical protein LV716_18350 [Flagellimonas sp. HMM57]|uniref:hypothetical protein n=1 Tax=unclassified Flagellimonas TaxID=2644544 RepID=UPI0013D60D36|nr:MULTISPECIES: hypothetical protein [unclassified Flagellimonas]UII76201.1 hypothetical protein LV716_18350 [Flagellimonas sp. HMM57]